jgi:hypothetical protein
METNEENGCGWVIKAPFTTNSESVRYPKSFEAMQGFMRSLSSKYYGHLPYLMIQPCMYNRREVKIVALNNQPVFKAGISTGFNSRSKSGISKVFGDIKEDILPFASQALQKFRDAVPFAITDGLFHIDIFQTAAGQMVVNEFESLDAVYESRVPGGDAATYNFLQNYWHEKIQSLIK